MSHKVPAMFTISQKTNSLRETQSDLFALNICKESHSLHLQKSLVPVAVVKGQNSLLDIYIDPALQNYKLQV